MLQTSSTPSFPGESRTLVEMAMFREINALRKGNSLWKRGLFCNVGPSGPTLQSEAVCNVGNVVIPRRCGPLLGWVGRAVYCMYMLHAERSMQCGVYAVCRLLYALCKGQRGQSFSQGFGLI